MKFMTTLISIMLPNTNGYRYHFSLDDIDADTCFERCAAAIFIIMHWISLILSAFVWYYGPIEVGLFQDCL